MQIHLTQNLMSTFAYLFSVREKSDFLQKTNAHHRKREWLTFRSVEGKQRKELFDLLRWKPDFTRKGWLEREKFKFFPSDVEKHLSSHKGPIRCLEPSEKKTGRESALELKNAIKTLHCFFKHSTERNVRTITSAPPLILISKENDAKEQPSNKWKCHYKYIFPLNLQTRNVNFVHLIYIHNICIYCQ